MNRRQAVLAAAALTAGGASASTQVIAQALTRVQVEALSAGDLARRAVARRAIEAVIWGMPVVNFDLMLQAMINSAGGKPEAHLRGAG